MCRNTTYYYVVLHTIITPQCIPPTLKVRSYLGGGPGPQQKPRFSQTSGCSENGRGPIIPQAAHRIEEDGAKTHAMPHIRVIHAVSYKVSASQMGRSAIDDNRMPRRLTTPCQCPRCL